MSHPKLVVCIGNLENKPKINLRLSNCEKKTDMRHAKGAWSNAQNICDNALFSLIMFFSRKLDSVCIINTEKKKQENTAASEQRAIIFFYFPKFIYKESLNTHIYDVTVNAYSCLEKYNPRYAQIMFCIQSRQSLSRYSLIYGESAEYNAAVLMEGCY